MNELDDKRIGGSLLEKGLIGADWLVWEKIHLLQAIWVEYGKGRLDLLEP